MPVDSVLRTINSVVGAQNSWEDYGLGVGLAGLVFFFLYIIRPRLIDWVRYLSRKTHNDFDDVISEILESMNWFLFLVIGLYVGGQFVEMRGFWRNVSDFVVLVTLMVYAVLAINKLAMYGLHKVLKHGGEGEVQDEGEVEMMEFILGRIIGIFLWVVAIVIVLQNLGFKVTALVGGLGIGGIAVAFALQSVLEDVFSYFSIYFDKPFKVGDFIVLGTESGTVQRVGIKSTRIKTLQGEELVVSNKELTSAQVHNFKKLEKRRISFVFGVTYETPVKQVKQIPSWVEKIIADKENASFDRCHFKEFGDFSLNFEVVYHVETSEFKVYMDMQQAINLDIMEKFEKEKVDFAYPTQVVYTAKK